MAPLRTTVLVPAGVPLTVRLLLPVKVEEATAKVLALIAAAKT